MADNVLPQQFLQSLREEVATAAETDALQAQAQEPLIINNSSHTDVALYLRVIYIILAHRYTYKTKYTILFA